MESNYQELVGKKCRLTTTGEEVWVLGLFYNHGHKHPYWFHIDDGISRGAEVRADLVELVS